MRGAVKSRSTSERPAARQILVWQRYPAPAARSLLHRMVLMKPG